MTDEASAAPATGAPTAESLVFVPGVAERLRAYVYLLIDPRTDLVFYVGKGNGNRAYDHAAAALVLLDWPTKKHLKMDIIRAIHAAGQQVRIEILRHGLTDNEAFLVEASAIDLLLHHGNLAPGETAATLSNIQSGHASALGLGTVEELAARYAARQVVISDPMVLIRPTNLWSQAKDDDQRYEATRKSWRVGAASRARVTHAAAVVGGIIRMIWRIDKWTDVGDNRSEFEGTRDPELEARYVWGDVSSLLPVGAQNPIRYVIPSDIAPSGAHVDEAGT